MTLARLPLFALVSMSFVACSAPSESETRSARAFQTSTDGGVDAAVDAVTIQGATLKTVFVLRTHAKADRTFEGDVLAFDLATGKPLGGFPIALRSEGRTDKVTTTTRSYEPGNGATARQRRKVRVSEKTRESYVNADASQLRQDIADAVADGIEADVPGAQLLD